MKPMKDLLNFSLINLDKPAGPTSYSVSEFVKRQLGLGKTSHMGTLDPKVTGVLPVTLGRACKLADYFIRHDKSYVGILETHKEQDIKELQKLIDGNFVGKIKQTPPHRSAVKREERTRKVFFWRLLETAKSSPLVERLDSSNQKSSSQSDGKAHAERGDLGNKGKSFLFECRVEGGTYIRKLCSDLGEMIGGAHMGELRRTEAGIFNESTLVDMFEFKSAVDKYKDGNEKDLRGILVPAEDAIRRVLPVVEVEKRAVKSLYIGRPLFLKDCIFQEGGSKTGSLDGSQLKTEDGSQLKIVDGSASPEIWRGGGVGKVRSKSDLKDGDFFALFCGEVFIGVYRKNNVRPRKLSPKEGRAIFGRSEFVFN